MEKFDLAIIGAGPAGLACALSLADSGLKIALIDKAKFPREKICGDALSADVLRQLQKFYPEVYRKFIAFNPKTASHGIRFYAPNGKMLDIPFQPSGEDAPGFICRRLDFDHFLFSQLTALNIPNMEVMQGFQVANITPTYDEIILEGFKSTISVKMLVGADGANGVARRKLLNEKVEPQHHCAGIRAYYKNVKGISEQNFIELHFLKSVLPGYFWIFPLPDNTVNVGLGILSKEVSRKNINLKKVLNDLISSYEPIAERFSEADLLQEPKGFGLPIGSKKRKISGDRFLLTGDAAGLIDPFTGEGIGNALRSGRYAAEQVKKCFAENNFSEKFNRRYDKHVYAKMWGELRVSRSMQRLLYYPSLFNYIVKRARKNDNLKRLLVNMLENAELKEDLLSPRFYLKLLLNKH